MRESSEAQRQLDSDPSCIPASRGRRRDNQSRERRPERGNGGGNTGSGSGTGPEPGPIVERDASSGGSCTGGRLARGSDGSGPSSPVPCYHDNYMVNIGIRIEHMQHVVRCENANPRQGFSRTDDPRKPASLGLPKYIHRPGVRALRAVLFWVSLSILSPLLFPFHLPFPSSLSFHSPLLTSSAASSSNGPTAGMSSSSDAVSGPLGPGQVAATWEKYGHTDAQPSIVNRLAHASKVKAQDFTHPLMHESTTEQALVDFDGLEDEYKAVNWNIRKKATITVCYGLMTSCSTWSTAM